MCKYDLMRAGYGCQAVRQSGSQVDSVGGLQELCHMFAVWTSFCYR
jgi:hypothetical protein